MASQVSLARFSATSQKPIWRRLGFGEVVRDAFGGRLESGSANVLVLLGLEHRSKLILQFDPPGLAALAAFGRIQVEIHGNDAELGPPAEQLSNRVLVRHPHGA